MAGSLIDTDTDGLFNWEEYIADTGPKNSNSFFRVACTVSNISWHSVTGRVYEVFHAATLFDAFTNAATLEHPANTFSVFPGFFQTKVWMK